MTIACQKCGYISSTSRMEHCVNATRGLCPMPPKDASDQEVAAAQAVERLSRTLGASVLQQPRQ